MRQPRLLEFCKSLHHRQSLHFPPQRIDQIHDLDRGRQEVDEAMDLFLGIAVFQDIEFQLYGVGTVCLCDDVRWPGRVIDEHAVVQADLFEDVKVL